jgi:hypothetical protein
LCRVFYYETLAVRDFALSVFGGTFVSFLAITVVLVVGALTTIGVVGFA